LSVVGKIEKTGEFAGQKFHSPGSCTLVHPPEIHGEYTYNNRHIDLTIPFGQFAANSELPEELAASQKGQ
jgi:hypothetical protein